MKEMNIVNVENKGILESRKTIVDVFHPLALNCQEVTELSYQKQLSYFFQELGSQPLTLLNTVITSFIMQESASLSTKKIRKYALLKYFKTVLKGRPLELATLVQHVNDIPLEKKATLALKEDDALSLEQVNIIKSIKLTAKQRAVFFGLVESGLRASELINIKLSDIKPSNHNDNVSVVTVLGKGNKLRDIYLNNDIIAMAREAYQGSVWLYEGKDGKALSYKSLYATVKAIGKKAGFKKVLHPHMLRHTFATLALKHGSKSIKAISTYLGHASTAITQDVYMHDGFTASDFEGL